MAITNEQMAKKAFDEANKEFNELEIKELKNLVLKTLTAIENTKKVVEEKNEEIRVLKLDLEDLRHGRLTEIRQRQNESPIAKKCSQIPQVQSATWIWTIPQQSMWQHTSGTYCINTSTGTSSNFYLSI